MDDGRVALRQLFIGEERRLLFALFEAGQSYPHKPDCLARSPNVGQHGFRDGNEHGLVIDPVGKGVLYGSDAQIAVTQFEGDGMPREALLPQAPAHHDAELVDSRLELFAGGEVFDEGALVAYGFHLALGYDFAGVDTACPEQHAFGIDPENPACTRYKQLLSVRDYHEAGLGKPYQALHYLPNKIEAVLHYQCIPAPAFRAAKLCL